MLLTCPPPARRVGLVSGERPENEILKRVIRQILQSAGRKLSAGVNEQKWCNHQLGNCANQSGRRCTPRAGWFSMSQVGPHISAWLGLMARSYDVPPLVHHSTDNGSIIRRAPLDNLLNLARSQPATTQAPKPSASNMIHRMKVIVTTGTDTRLGIVALANESW